MRFCSNSFTGKPKIPISTLLSDFVNIWPASQWVAISVTLSAQSAIWDWIGYPPCAFQLASGHFQKKRPASVNAF